MTNLPALFSNTDVAKRLERFPSVFLDFDRFFDNALSFVDVERQMSYPPVNVAKTETGYEITLAVAGFSSDDLTVEVTSNGYLTVSGESKVDTTKSYIHNGIAARKFARSWRMNDTLEVEGVTLKNGLLTITVKQVKPVDPPTTRIPISVE